MTTEIFKKKHEVVKALTNVAILEGISYRLCQGIPGGISEETVEKFQEFFASFFFETSEEVPR